VTRNGAIQIGELSSRTGCSGPPRRHGPWCGQAARAASRSHRRWAPAPPQAHALAATHGFGPGTTATHEFGPEPEHHETRPAVATAAPSAAALRTWRYTTGAFRVHTPVSEPREMRPLEENTLAIMKWRLSGRHPSVQPLAPCPVALRRIYRRPRAGPGR
jgi:hypothetical protein